MNAHIAMCVLYDIFNIVFNSFSIFSLQTIITFVFALESMTFKTLY